MGNAPGNARGPISCFAQAGENPATDSATENKPPEERASVAVWRKTFRGPESDPRKRLAEGDGTW